MSVDTAESTVVSTLSELEPGATVFVVPDEPPEFPDSPWPQGTVGEPERIRGSLVARVETALRGHSSDYDLVQDDEGDRIRVPDEGPVTVVQVTGLRKE